jgi:hypothetical protein
MADALMGLVRRWWRWIVAGETPGQWATRKWLERRTK